MDRLTEREFEVLLKEYDNLQAGAREYNTRIFQIKGWSIGIFSAMCGLAIVQNQSLFLLIPFFSTILFCGMECLYKGFQTILDNRMLEVEEIFLGKAIKPEVGVITHRFKNRDITVRGRIKRFTASLYKFNVVVLYFGQLVILLILAVIFKLKNTGILIYGG